jgi:hypothetical protein
MTLELILVLPVLFVIIWGGSAVAYSSLAKASLQMTAERAARELAAGEAAARIPANGPLYRYGEFTETYGLPRARVQMLVQKQGDLIVAGACFRVPLTLPTFRPAPPELLEDLNGVVPDDVLASADKVVDIYRDAKEAVHEGQELWANVRSLWTDTSDLLQDPPQEFKSYSGPGGGMAGALGYICRGHGLVVTTQAAFWSERSLKSLPPLKVTIEISENGGPFTSADSLNVAHLQPASTRIRIGTTPKDPVSCYADVVFESGRSQAEDLVKNNPRPTEAGNSVNWVFYAVANTNPQDVPIAISCTNGQSGTRFLKITND